MYGGHKELGKKLVNKILKDLELNESRLSHELEADHNKTLLVTCPAFPEVTTFGADEAEAIKHRGGDCSSHSQWSGDTRTKRHARDISDIERKP
jgi:hypothetical protein